MNLTDESAAIGWGYGAAIVTLSLMTEPDSLAVNDVVLAATIVAGLTASIVIWSVLGYYVRSGR